MKDGSRLLFVDAPGAGAPLGEPFAGGSGAGDIFTRPAGGWTGQIRSELRRRVEHPGLWGGPVDV